MVVRFWHGWRAAGACGRSPKQMVDEGKVEQTPDRPSTPPFGAGSSLVWSQEVATLQGGQWPESFGVMELGVWACGKPSRCLAGSTKLMRDTRWPHIMSENFQTKTTSEKFEGAQLVGTKVLLSTEWLSRLDPNWTS